MYYRVVQPSRPATPQLAIPPARRGVGEYPGATCYDPARPAWLPFWLSSPTELACVLKVGAANVYESAQYGSIPRAGELAPPPVAGVPAPIDVAAGTAVPPMVTPEQWAAWKARMSAQLQTQQDSGAWNPSGNLPVTATGLSAFWDQYGAWVIGGGAVLGGLALFKAVRR